MNSTLTKISPYLLVLFGLLILFLLELGPAAGVFILLGLVMIIESIWPENWDFDKQKELEKS